MSSNEPIAEEEKKLTPTQQQQEQEGDQEMTTPKETKESAVVEDETREKEQEEGAVVEDVQAEQQVAESPEKKRDLTHEEIRQERLLRPLLQYRALPEGKDRYPNDERDANPISKLFLYYTQRVISCAGTKDDLMTVDDIDLPSGGDTSTTVYSTFQPLWVKEVANTEAKNEKLQADWKKKDDAWLEEQKKKKATAPASTEPVAGGDDADKKKEDEEKDRPKKPDDLLPNINSVLIQYLWHYFVPVFLAGIIAAAGPFTGIVLMGFIRDFVASSYTANPDPDWHGGVMAAAWFVMQIIAALAESQIARWVARCNLRVECCLRLMMIKKTMVLSPLALKKIGGPGVLVQHFTSDLQSIVQSFAQVYGQMAIMLRIVGAAVYLGIVADWPALVPLTIFCIVIPINYRIIQTFITHFIRKQMAGDARTKKVMETLNSVRVIKFYGWEKSFREAIKALREPELKEVYILMGQIAKFMMSIALASPAMQATLFIVITYVNGKPDVVLFFQAVGILGILQQSIIAIPQIYSAYSRMNVAMDRVAKILSAEERDPVKYHINEEGAEVGDCIINNIAASDEKKMGEESSSEPIVTEEGEKKEGDEDKKNREAVFAWPPELPPPIPEGLPPAILEMYKKKMAAMPKADGKVKTLHIDCGPDGSQGFSAKSGELVMVVGKVGSGKSSLCGAFLSEMTVNSGLLTRKGKVAYVPQNAWILNATVRNNILINIPYDEDKYNMVLEAVDLMPDLKQLPNGDLTEVGEKGINLSGGQKQRLSLARALYQEADIYIFDDPLSALDAHVGRHVFDEAINGILKDKTRILITNQMNYLGEATRVYVSDNMTIRQQEVPDSNDLPPTPSTDEEKKNENPLVAMLRAWTKTGNTGAAGTTVRAETPGAKLRAKGRTPMLREKAHKEGVAGAAKAGTLSSTEERNSGSVRGSTMTKYVNSFGGPGFWIVTVILHLFISACAIFAQLWMAFWQELKWVDFHTRYPIEFYLGIYALALLTAALVSAMQQFHFRSGAVNAPRQLYDQMVNGVLHAPMEFFDTTPVGRIITRFTSDSGALDFELPLQVNMTLVITFAFIGATVGVCYAIPYSTPVFVVAFVVLMFAQPSVAVVILRRLASSTQGPVFNLYQEVINGSSSIRAMDIVEFSVKRFELSLDEKNAATLVTAVAFAAIRLRVNLIMAFVAAIIMLVIMLTRASLSPTLVVFGVNNIGMVALLMGAVLLQRGFLLMALNSIERMMDYTSLEAESEGSQTVPDNWPSQGEIEFENVNARYREGLPLVLKDLNLVIKGGHKVGVCGRTGSGKSTMLLTVFRIIPLVTGSVVRIDGIDTSTIPLSTLRSRVAAIPQEPILFSGSVLMNLDPTIKDDNTEMKAKLRESLTLCHLEDTLIELAKRKQSKAGPPGGMKGGPGSPGTGPPRAGGPPVAGGAASPTAGAGAKKADPEETPKKEAENTPKADDGQAVEPSEKTEDKKEDEEPEKKENGDAGSPKADEEPKKEEKKENGDAGSPKADEEPKKEEKEELDLLALELADGDLSVGQKQLLCLARAVSRNAKILVLDEATSSVDVHTDSLIQKTIRTVFKDCTVITVAHRLNTIRDSDRIIVLDQGSLAEFGPPDHLLMNEDSIFSGLVADAEAQDDASPH